MVALFKSVGERKIYILGYIKDELIPVIITTSLLLKQILRGVFFIWNPESFSNVSAVK